MISLADDEVEVRIPFYELEEGKLHQQYTSSSESFEDLSFVLMVLPANRILDESLSAYIFVTPSDNLGRSWYFRDVTMEIDLVHPDKAQTTRRIITESFTCKKNSTGVDYFASLIPAVAEGFLHPGGDLVFRARVTHVNEAGPYRLEDSCEFQGLHNCGTLCYINSLLQVLFHLGKFRELVYQFPNSPRAPVCSALREIFVSLQVPTRQVPNPMELVQAFRWANDQIFLQHDIHEFFNFMFGKIEDELKAIGPEVEGTSMKEINHLFEATMLSIISCKSVKYISKKEEPIWSIPIDVKGNENLQTALEKFCEKELLCGENLYDAGDHGKQEAYKYYTFKTLPPVVQFTLKRFEFDVQALLKGMAQNMYKINDRFAFEDEINLDFLTSEELDSHYTLHSVVVHTGGPYSGHYFSFIRANLPDLQFYRFDDESVSPAMKASTIDEGFGGFYDADPAPDPLATEAVVVIDDGNDENENENANENQQALEQALEQEPSTPTPEPCPAPLVFPEFGDCALPEPPVFPEMNEPEPVSLVVSEALFQPISGPVGEGGEEPLPVDGAENLDSLEPSGDSPLFDVGSPVGPAKPPAAKPQKKSSAYVLTYVKTSDIPEIMRRPEVPPLDVRLPMMAVRTSDVGSHTDISNSDDSS